MFACHSGSTDDIVDAAEAYETVIFAIQQLSEASPDLLVKPSIGSAATLVAAAALLSSLIQPDTEQIGLALPCSAVLAKIIAVANRTILSGRNDSNPISDLARGTVESHIRLLEELAVLPPATGRQQQQRQIRRVIKTFLHSSTLGTSTWIGLAAVARSLTSRILRAESDASTIERHQSRRDLAADIDGLHEDQSKTWQNLISYLCATSSSCQVSSSPPPSLSHVLGKGLLPKVFDDEMDPTSTLENFLRECVDLLPSSSIHVRESVKEALGNELSIVFLQLLLAQMSRLLSHCIGPTGVTVSEPFTHFTEQAISIIRLSVDRMSASENAGSLHIEMGEIMLALARYIHQLSRDDLSLRIKAKLCYLCEAELAKPSCLVFFNNSLFRNTMLQWIVEWSTESFRDTNGYHPERTSDGRLQRELDQACLRAMVPITEGLVLNVVGEGARDTHNVARSRLFHRHYLHLVQVIERSHSTEVRCAGCVG